MRIERVDVGGSTADDGRRQRRSRDRQARRNVDVGDVSFGDVPSATARKLAARLVDAAVAFEAERFPEAERLLDSIDRLAPGVPEVYELRGLVRYRLGQWKRAIADIERFHSLTGSVDQHPVWADCCRAMRWWQQADALWDELREVSPSAEIVEEGRLVYAGSLADRDRLDEAIRLLERAPRPNRRPAVHHLRRWYVLADLHERAGDLGRARRVFRDILDVESDFGDVAERLSALG